jgi:proline iminopeptidase
MKYLLIICLLTSSCLASKETLGIKLILGKGLPLIVIHGGPGMNCKYLQPGLKDLQKHRTLIFYDQKNCKDILCKTKIPNFSELVEQLKSIVDYVRGFSNNRKYGFIAHSWGSLLVMEFLKTNSKAIHPSEIIFVTPVPFKESILIEDWEKIEFEYSFSDKIKINYLESNPRRCISSLNTIFKYFVFDKNFHLPDFFINCVFEKHIMNQMKNYDYSDVYHLLPEKTIFVTGEKDPFFKDPRFKWKIIERSGHFPYIENKEKFISVVSEFLIFSITGKD